MYQLNTQILLNEPNVELETTLGEASISIILILKNALNRIIFNRIYGQAIVVSLTIVLHIPRH